MIFSNEILIACLKWALWCRAHEWGTLSERGRYSYTRSTGILNFWLWIGTVCLFTAGDHVSGVIAWPQLSAQALADIPPLPRLTYCGAPSMDGGLRAFDPSCVLRGSDRILYHPPFSMYALPSSTIQWQDCWRWPPKQRSFLHIHEGNETWQYNCQFSCQSLCPQP